VSCCGLKKKFVDVKNHNVKVRNSLCRVKIFENENTFKRELRVKNTKTKSSIRTVFFAKTFAKTLELYFKEQTEKWFENGLKFDEDSLIFTTDSCKPVDPVNYYKSWRRLLKRIKVGFKKVHAIRDTFATTLIRRGVKIHDLKEILGHSSISTTEKYYIFCFPEDKKDAAELLSDFIPQNNAMKNQVGKKSGKAKKVSQVNFLKLAQL